MNLSAFTWYDLVGVLPGAPAEQIRREYDSKASLLKPAGLLSGAPSQPWLGGCWFRRRDPGRGGVGVDAA